MSKEDKAANNASLPPAPRAVTIISAIAVLVASYLVWHSLNSGSQLAGCGGEGAGCSEVLDTRWGTWFGIPVSIGGLLTYVGIFLISLLMRKKATTPLWVALLGLTVLASASGIWFISLQVFVVKSYCWYCMTVHACGLILAFLVLKNIPAEMEDPKKKKRKIEAVPLKQKVMAVGAGLLGVLVLSGGQIYSGRVSIPPIPQPANPPAQGQPLAPTTQAPPPADARREVLLAKGALRFPLGEYPIFGSPDAPNVVAHFFDFTCPACREFHPSLMTNHQPNENNTALVMIPVPLDAVCNPAVRQTAYGHQNACEYARMALAIWSIRPDVYSRYDQFIFEGQYPPPLSAARGFAEQLVGAADLTAAMSNPAINDTLRAGLSMFYSPAFTDKALPALASKDGIVVGIQPPALLTNLFSGR